MFRHFLSVLGLLAIIGAESSCSPPRPRENPPLASGGTGVGATAPGVGGSDPLGQGGEGASLGGQPPAEGGAIGAGGSESPCAKHFPSASSGEAEFSKANLLSSISACATLRYCELEEAARALAVRGDVYVKEPSLQSKSSFASALSAATRAWARVEVLAVGPAANTKQDMQHGQGLGDLVYSWPNVSRCRVEEQFFGRAYARSTMDDLVQVPINSRGLFALEYLTHYAGSDNACSPFSVTNADDAWNVAAPETLAERRLEYLAIVSQDVMVRAGQIYDTWDQSFGRILEGGESYMGVQGALNAVAQGLTYVEVELKDYKVGRAAGLYEGAPVERPELSFSSGGTELMRQNLLGFRDVFMGCGQGGEGLGYDDWLSVVGHDELAEELVLGLQATLRLLADFPESAEATTEQWRSLHETLKLLTDPLKTEFFGSGSPLGLTLPAAVEGDTD